MNILLASSSPRRKELLLQIHWEPRIVKSHFNEVKTLEEAEKRKSEINHPLLSSFAGPDLVCALNALGKAEGADRGEKGGVSSPSRRYHRNYRRKDSREAEGPGRRLPDAPLPLRP